MRSLFIALCLLTLPHLATAEIYQIVDDKGRKTFTNIVPPDQHDLQKVELSTPNLSHDSNVHEENDLYYETLRAEEEQHREIGNRLNKTEQSARELLKQREAELIEAREIRSGDFFNLPGKGLRYTEAYHQRIRAAELQRDSAQQQLDEILNRRPAPAPSNNSNDDEYFDSHLPR